MSSEIKIAAVSYPRQPVSPAMLSKVTKYLQAQTCNFNYTFTPYGDVRVWASLGGVHGTNTSRPEHAEMATALRLHPDVFLDVLTGLHSTGALRRVGNDQLGYAYEVKMSTLSPAEFARVHAKDHATLFTNQGNPDPNAQVPIIEDNFYAATMAGGSAGLGSGLLPVDIVYGDKVISWRTCSSDVDPSLIVGWGRRGDYEPLAKSAAYKLTEMAEQESLGRAWYKLLNLPVPPASSDPLSAAADKVNQVTGDLDAYLSDDTSGCALIADEKAGCERLVSAAEALQGRISDVADLYGSEEPR